MKLSEIIVNPVAATIETVINENTAFVIKIYNQVKVASKDFVIPAPQLYPRDTIYEYLDMLEFWQKTITNKQNVPQAMAAIRELFNYFER